MVEDPARQSIRKSYNAEVGLRINWWLVAAEDDHVTNVERVDKYPSIATARQDRCNHCRRRHDHPGIGAKGLMAEGELQLEKRLITPAHLTSREVRYCAREAHAPRVSVTLTCTDRRQRDGSHCIGRKELCPI
jgi:hypothetical protein